MTAGCRERQERRGEQHGAAAQDDGLPHPVDQPALQRPAERLPDREHPSDGSGSAVGTGRAVHQQHDGQRTHPRRHATGEFGADEPENTWLAQQRPERPDVQYA